MYQIAVFYCILKTNEAFYCINDNTSDMYMYDMMQNFADFMH